MPAKKTSKRRAKVIVRDLSSEGKKAIDRKALGKVRGGALSRVAFKRTASGDDPGCVHDGHKCGILHCTPAAKATDELWVHV